MPQQGASPQPHPTPLTSFVARELEVAAVGTLLRRADVRLVTLTGPGGVGKTRLALRTADELRADFDAVFVVSLGPVPDPELVLPTVVRQVGLHDATTRPLADRLITVAIRIDPGGGSRNGRRSRGRRPR